MDDERDSSQSGQSLLVATTLATLILAGSAVFLRSKFPQLRLSVYGNTNHVAEHNVQYDASGQSSQSFRTYHVNDLRVPVADKTQNTSLKNSRSKERRRRGKDPMKELMKGGKKAKDIARLLKNVEQNEHFPAGPSSPSASTVAHSQQQSQSTVSRSKRSRSPDPSASSRSVSSISASSSRQHVKIADLHQNDSEDDRAFDIPDEELYNIDTVSTDSQRPSQPDSHYTDPHYIYHTPSGPSTTHTTHSPSHSHSTSHDSTPSLASLATTLSYPDSVATTSTAVTSVGSMSPSMSMKPYDYDEQEQEEGEQQVREQQKFTPTGNGIQSSKSFPSKTDNVNDTHHPSRKPPRFRSKNNTSSPQPGIPISTSMPPIPSRASTLTPSSGFPDASEHHGSEMSAPMDFPTLNSSINSISTSASRPGDRERTSSAVHVTEIDGHHSPANGPGNMIRRASTPLRTPTPSNLPGSVIVPNSASNSGSGTGSPGPASGKSTPPPSQSASSVSSTVSTQTQIASLKGALEATRMREEKAKSDLERTSQELEMLKWEMSSWRRREGELQTHIHHLAHQVQSYAAFYMSSAMSSPVMQSPSNGLYPQHLVPGLDGSPSGSKNGSKAPSPSPNERQQVPLSTSTPDAPGGQAAGHQHAEQEQEHVPQENGNGLPSHGLMSQLPMNGMSPMSPLGAVSPLSFSAVSSPHSPHFPYPPYPMPGQASHIHGHSQYGMPFPLQMHPSHFLSMLNTNPMSTSVSASSVLSMPNGEEDILPDPSANDSPSPGPKDALNRGRKLRKGFESSLGDGWVGIGSSGDEASASGSSERPHAEREDNDDDEDDNGGVSELLADAILKRPGSIRLGSGRRKEKRRNKTGSAHEDDKGDLSSSPPHSSPGTPGSSDSLQSSSSPESPVEFVFPSISDWGNVTKKKAEAAVVAVEPVQEDSQSTRDLVNTSPGAEKVEGEQITPTAAASGTTQKESTDVANMTPDSISLPEPVINDQEKVVQV
ncbi:hypothetical protein K435DRAFT_864342 [Dendrothele bispora CBS 962.96]|uniref:Uncharacterized protein n=1 Tax=Dendrothele bispora (strain CBS 962.96) TaxID=1314807 RepID=A0A4S8LME9_DENBC|nr:hypothetical protein K435DRAFT_864342 [Dendrothele bispora CBS 962.96]